MATIDLGMGIGTAVEGAAKIISLFKADPTVKAQLQSEIELTALQGQIQIILEQIKVNAVEAANKSLFVAGWRPFVGWICGGALAVPAMAYLVQCASILAHGRSDFPVYNTSDLLMMLGGLLGLGGMRTYEKTQGADKPGDVGH